METSPEPTKQPKEGKEEQAPALMELTTAMLLKEELRQKEYDPPPRQWRPAVPVSADAKEASELLDVEKPAPTRKRPAAVVRPNTIKRPATTIGRVTIGWDDGQKRFDALVRG